MEKERYLGDAVYASHDGWHIWLRTEGSGQQIALEPAVYAALVQYHDDLVKARRAAQEDGVRS